MKSRPQSSSMLVTGMIFSDARLWATGQRDTQVVPSVAQYRYQQSTPAEFPEPTKYQCRNSGHKHQGGTLVQRMKAPENQSHQCVRQAEWAEAQCDFFQKPVLQTQTKYCFFGYRRNQQQAQQGQRCAGSGAQAQTDLGRDPRTNRATGKGQGIGSAFGLQGKGLGLGHGLRMIAAALLLLPPVLSFAGLGEGANSAGLERMGLHARPLVSASPLYSLQEHQGADGSRLRQYVAANGTVFAVSWNTLYKPDLSAMLGTSYPAYAVMARAAARQPGIHRRLRHEDLDLVLQSSAHLHVFSGFAFRRSMFPRGLSPRQMGLE